MTVSAPGVPVDPLDRDRRRRWSVSFCGAAYEVDARLRAELGRVARLAGDDVGVAQVRSLLHRGDELGAELTERQVLAAFAHQAEGGDLPEGGGPAVAEDDLVAVREGEEVGEPAAQTSDLVLDRRLPVRGAEQRLPALGDRGGLLPADLARAGAEAPVGRLEGVRDRQRRARSAMCASL